MNKSIIVTGGGGFVGANVVKRLLQEGYKVHVFVRNGSSLWRLQEVLKKIQIHEGILNNGKALGTLIKKISPFAIYHLATYGSYPSQKDTQKMIDINIKGTLNLLESVKSINYKQLIVAGSSSEYGKKEKPMKESDVLEPNNFYAATKAAQTYLSQVFAKIYHKPLIILRLFNVYGYFEEEGRLVRSVIEAVLNRQPVLLATGQEARDFIFAEDVVDAFLTVTKNLETFYGEIFNIGTGKQTTIKELAEFVIAIAGIKVPVKLNAYEGRTWDAYHWVADINKTSKILKWKPKHSLEEGLKKTIEWYQKYEAKRTIS